MVEDSSRAKAHPVSSEASPPASRELVEAASALFCDMVLRAQMNAPMNGGEVIVEAGCGVWEDFCAALGEEVTTAALANTPDGWRDSVTLKWDHTPEADMRAAHWVAELPNGMAAIHRLKDGYHVIAAGFHAPHPFTTREHAQEYCRQRAADQIAKFLPPEVK